MRYHLIDLVQTDDGRGPALPDGVSFGELADPGFGSSFALYDAFLEEEELTPRIRPVPQRLQYLIDSGKAFPPALALARAQVGRDFQQQTPTREVFLTRYAELLRAVLEWQPASGYFLAEARVEELGYLSEGDFVWIVGSNATSVSWISGDYFVYSNPRGHFRLNQRHLDGIRRWKAPAFGTASA